MTNAQQHLPDESLGLVSSPRPVPEYFLEQLHLIDKALEPRWNPNKCRWEIWRDKRYVMTVQTLGGEYAPLDSRVLQKLFLCDTQRYASTVQYIQQLHLEDEAFLKMRRKEQDEYIRACYRDMAPFLRGRKSVVASRLALMKRERQAQIEEAKMKRAMGIA